MEIFPTTLNLFGHWLPAVKLCCFDTSIVDPTAAGSGAATITATTATATITVATAAAGIAGASKWYNKWR